MKGRKDIKSDELEAFLGRNTSFEGKMGFGGMARLDGKFHGEIFSGEILIIGETAAINAEINVGTLVVDGEVSGKFPQPIKSGSIPPASSMGISIPRPW